MNAPASPRSKLITAAKILVPLGVVVFIGMQLVPVQGVGVNPPTRYQIDAPPEVEALLRKACFDCHSNETRWPFYARIAPGSWLLARDVKKGRGRFNMSEWGETDEEERSLDKEAAWDEVEKGEMPPWFYLPGHPDAYLNAADKALLKSWFLAPKKEAPKDEKKPAEDKPADKPAEAPPAPAAK